MPDFCLEPDEIEPERPERARPVRMVSTGIHPTADLPKHRGGKDAPSCYLPCEACGAAVLVGVTGTGTRLALDTHSKTYLVDFDHGASVPRLVEGRGYPVHQCQGACPPRPGSVC